MGAPRQANPDALESDLKRTREDMVKLGAARTGAARTAKQKVAKTYFEPQAEIQDLAVDQDTRYPAGGPGGPPLGSSTSF
jgi:hypothetical protein